jgi:hypothetical protein
VVIRWFDQWRREGARDDGFYWPAVASFWPNRRLLAAISSGRCEALIQFDETFPVVATTSSTNTGIVYVSFLEAAPWNRAGGATRIYSGVGISLLRILVARSLELGRKGRIGLHSTRNAAAFYDSLGFKAASQPGPNEYWEPYLELPSQAAAILLR